MKKMYFNSYLGGKCITLIFLFGHLQCFESSGMGGGGGGGRGVGVAC